MSKLLRVSMRVFMDDYDQPLVAYVLVDNSEVYQAIDTINAVGKGTYFAQVFETQTLEEVVAELTVPAANDADSDFFDGSMEGGRPPTPEPPK